MSRFWDMEGMNSSAYTNELVPHPSPYRVPRKGLRPWVAGRRWEALRFPRRIKSRHQTLQHPHIPLLVPGSSTGVSAMNAHAQTARRSAAPNGSMPIVPADMLMPIELRSALALASLQCHTRTAQTHRGRDQLHRLRVALGVTKSYPAHACGMYPGTRHRRQVLSRATSSATAQSSASENSAPAVFSIRM